MDKPFTITGNSALGFINLGCANAVLDCQTLVNQLFAAGYDIVDERSPVPVIIAYCCGDFSQYINDLQALGSNLPDDGQLVVTGRVIVPAGAQQTLPAMVYVPAEQLLPHVEALLPVDLATTGNDASTTHSVPTSASILDDSVRLTPPHYAYLPLSTPAAHLCSFSAEVGETNTTTQSAHTTEAVFAHAKQLVESGVQELLLVAPQAMSDEEVILLCQRLTTLNVWLRLHDVFSPRVIQQLIPLMKQGDILPSLIVSCADTEAESLPINQLSQWRASVPALVINVRVIVGQKPQTNESLTVLLDSLTALNCCEVIAVPYQGLPHVDGDNEEILNIIQHIDRQQTILAEQRQHDRIGGIEPVMIDDTIEDEEINNIALGRSIYDAPGIGGIVQIEDIYGAQAGHIVHVEIIDIVGKDMIAIPA